MYIGIGSNLGDRQATILAALQRLRAHASVDRVSAFYESPPADGADGPDFLNVAAELHIAMERPAFEAAIFEIQSALGRVSQQRLAARPIDIDILAFDDDVHPELSTRAYNLVPLAEIAPAFAPTAAALGATAPRRCERSLHFSSNRQEEVPDVRLSLSRVGVAKVKRIIPIEIGGRTQVYHAEFSMVADLAPDKAGVHMSRFSELLEEATLDVLSQTDVPTRVEQLVERVASAIVRSQNAICADVRLRAEFGLDRWTPVSGKRSHEIYTLIAIAHADEAGARRVIGVEAEGMTACPCAQQMMREHSTHELRIAGFSEAEAQRALDVLPLATHNQRGRGRLLIGALPQHAQNVHVEDLVEIVESSMSSETYDLLKRPDEFFVVNKAHRNPKFVEDVVRGMLARALDMYADFPDDTFAFARQINDESIHKHDAFAEGYGSFAELRQELRSGTYVTRKTDLATWLQRRPELQFARPSLDEN